MFSLKHHREKISASLGVLRKKIGAFLLTGKMFSETKTHLNKPITSSVDSESKMTETYSSHYKWATVVGGNLGK